LYLTIFLPSSPQLPFLTGGILHFLPYLTVIPPLPRSNAQIQVAVLVTSQGARKGLSNPNRGFGSLKHWGVGLGQSHSPLPLS
jgi:hypothetical protein